MLNSSSTQCDQQLISDFVDGQIDQARQIWLENHLESCPRCRQELEHQSAAPEIWDKVTAFLNDNPDDWMPSPACSISASQQGSLKANHAACVESVLRSLAPSDDPQMLGRINSYEISGVIGSGGMGVVLKAFDPSLRRVVAIKVLAPHLASSNAARQRFAREAQAAAAIANNHVIEIYSVSEVAALPFLVMPYVRGMSLQKRIDQTGRFSIVEILRIGIQIARGLAAAHEQGLVHRDIKPANILLDDGVERLVITDFGLARTVDDASITRTGVIAGTPQFMSPEQARGDSMDHRSDLFSLGSVMYVLATGRTPFRAESAYGVLRKITDDAARPIREINPEIPIWFCRLVDRLHAKDPNGRYDWADKVASLMQQCLAHLQSAQSDLPGELLPVQHRLLNGMLIMKWLSVFVALLGSGVVASIFWLSVFKAEPSGPDNRLPETNRRDSHFSSSNLGAVEELPPWEAAVDPACKEVFQRASRLAEQTALPFGDAPRER